MPDDIDELLRPLRHRRAARPGGIRSIAAGERTWITLTR